MSLACRRDYHPWRLYMPVADLPYAKCDGCGQRASLEEARRNFAWQDRQLAQKIQEIADLRKALSQQA